jgi:thiol:disulfide interchange protein DsbD
MIAKARIVLACLLFIGIVGTANPQVANDDPFAPENAIGAGKPGTPPAAKLDVKPTGKTPPTSARIDFAFDVKPVPARRGEVITLTIGVAPRPGFYTYPMTQKTPEQSDTQLADLTFAKSSAFQPIWPTQEPPAEFYDTHVASVGTVLRFTKPFTWTQEILVQPDAPTGPQVLKFTIALQVCDKDSCLQGQHNFEITIPISDAPPVPLSDSIKARLKAKQEIKEVPVPGAVTAEAPTTNPDASKGIAGKTSGKNNDNKTDGTTAPTTPANPANQGLWAVLLAAVGSAFLMLLTPCVFPMIPITVSFFVKQSEKQHHRAFRMAFIYSITIVIVLTAAVLLLGKFVIDLANDPFMNLALGAVLIFFALSLFGMYDIELPSFLARYTSAHESKGGLLGVFFMALTFTITSFTCTGPFLGPLLASFGAMRVSYTHLVIAALAYSATFAAPFFLLALFPSLLKKMPRSGGWLNSVKVVMGFLELAAALKFLGNTDFALNPGNPWFFNYDTVLCSWIALSIACGLYLLGIFRLPHDEPREHVGVFPMVLATIFIGLGLYLLPALWRVQPLGIIGEKLVAFLPLDTRPKTAGPGAPGEAHLDWLLDYEQAWKQAVKENKLIFIDFTGVNCINCRDNEYRVFPKPAVRKELEKYVRVQMYNDFVPGLPRAESRAAALRNQELQSNTFNDYSTPLYVVFKPAKDAPFDGDKLKGTILAQRGGTIRDADIPAFVENILQAPLNGAVAQNPSDEQVAKRPATEKGP